MAEAVVFGIVASSALVAGGTLGAFWQAPSQTFPRSFRSRRNDGK